MATYCTCLSSFHVQYRKSQDKQTRKRRKMTTRRSKRSFAGDLSPTVPPTAASTRRVGTRTSATDKMTCIDYGANRRTDPELAGALWCHACDMFETDKPLKPKLKQTGRYKCSSNHTLDGPEMKEEGWMTKRQRRVQVPSPAPPVAPPKPRGPPAHIQRIRDLEKEVSELKMYRIMYIEQCQKKRKLQKEISELRRERVSRAASSNLNLAPTSFPLESTATTSTATTTATPASIAAVMHNNEAEDNAGDEYASLVDGATDDISSSPTKKRDPKVASLIAEVEELFGQHKSFSNCKKKRLACIMAEACMSDDFLSGAVRVEVLRKAKNWYREFVFTPEAILREMDLSGAELNLTGIELLRRVEREAVNRVLPELEKRRFHGVLPSRGTVSRRTREVHLFADDEIPLEQFQAESGEGWTFKSLAKVTKMILCGHGLDSTAKNRSVQVSLALDAAPITKSLSLFSIALVVTDKCARCPRTGKPLGLHTLEGKSQSRDLVYQLMQIVGKETKENLKAFEPVFDFFKQAETEAGLIDACYKTIEHLVHADMACTWKTTNLGGGAKAKKSFCHCCHLQSDNCEQPNRNHCKRCRNRHVGKHVAHPDWRCFHHEFVDPASVADYQAEADTIIAAISENLDAVLEVSQIKQKDGRTAHDQTLDELSIAYKPPNENRKSDFHELLVTELSIRNMDCLGTIEELREKLETRLEEEHSLKDTLAKIKHCEPARNAFVAVTKMIPCILHLEMRVGIKMVEMILCKGIDGLPSSAAKTRFAKEVETLVNNDIFPDTLGAWHWQFPLTEKKGKDGEPSKLVVGDIRLTNPRVRDFMNGMELLINKCVSNLDHKAKLKRMVKHYRKALKLLRLRRDYQDSEIELFQDEIDLFFQDWVFVFGRAGITNYIHLLHAGHIYIYMMKHRCLYRHSQQGYESMNGLVTSVFFKRTQRGGFGSTIRSRLLPLARWLQRRVIWSAFEMKEIWPEKPCLWYDKRLDLADSAPPMEGVAEMDEEADAAECNGGGGESDVNEEEIVDIMDI